MANGTGAVNLNAGQAHVVFKIAPAEARTNTSLNEPFAAMASKYNDPYTRDVFKALGAKVSTLTGENMDAVSKFFQSATRFDKAEDAAKAAIVLANITGGKKEQLADAVAGTYLTPLLLVATERDVQRIKSPAEERADAAVRLAGAATMLDKMSVEDVSKTPARMLEAELVKRLDAANKEIDARLKEASERRVSLPEEPKTMELQSLFVVGLPIEGAGQFEVGRASILLVPLKRE